MGRLETRRKAIEERFSREKLAELEAREKEQAAAVASGLEKLASVSASHSMKSSELAAIAATFEEMRRLRESFLNLDREVLTLSAQADSLKKELQAAVVDEIAYAESKKRLAGLVAERTGLAEQAKTAGARSAALSKEAGAIETRMKAASEGRARMEHSRRELHSLLGGLAIQELQARQKEAEKSLLAAESERRSLERSIAETEELVGKLRPGLAECPLCASKLDDACAGHIRQEKKAFVEQKRNRMAELSSVAMTVKTDNDALLARVKAASLLSEKITVLERELSGTEVLPEKKAQLDSELSAVRTAQENLQKQSAGLAGSLEKLYVELNRMETLLARKKALAELEKRLSGARMKRETVKFDEKSFEALRGSVESLRLEAGRLFSSKQALETQSKMAGDMLALVRGELSTLKKMESDAASLAKLEEELAIYRNAVMDTQISLRASLIDAINTAMNEVWPIFYPYRNYPSLRIAVTEKDYSFEVNDDGAWKSLETVASGGERASAALTLRVALAMVLTPKLGWLILDEPTHNLDAEAVEMLSSALQTKVPQVVNQTFVITHEEGLMGSDFASSYRLSRDKEHNGDTKTDAI
jgi:ABC-type lipoprotein export system ATPase subunit